MLASWLEERDAFVVVEGVRSSAWKLINQVFQGTVWGPQLWNIFYADARRAIHETGFLETVFADDLNCFRAFDGHASNDDILNAINTCQTELHSWGHANQVVFDPF